MSLPRFHVPEKLAPGSQLRLPDNAATHASRALRMQVGHEAILFNGDGNDYLCTLTSVGKHEVNVKISSVLVNERESPLRITLAQAISTGDRMDFSIQKSVELGVTAIQPIASQRSMVKLSGERAEKRREHWQNVVISACEQSGRAIVPEVSAPLSLSDWLARNTAPQLRLTLSPVAEQCLHQLAKPETDICLLIGAEGGLTQDEITLASQHGFIPVRLGQRILRTETAPIAAISAIQTLWGDFSA